MFAIKLIHHIPNNRDPCYFEIKGTKEKILVILAEKNSSPERMVATLSFNQQSCDAVIGDPYKFLLAKSAEN